MSNSTVDAPEEVLFHGSADDWFELSNFYPRTIKLNGLYWPSAEHYYQAQKFSQSADREKIRHAGTCDEAWRLGRNMPGERVTDWGNKKTNFMREALYAKFKQNEDLRAVLLATGDAPIKQKSAKDNFWGIGADGQGQNQLGMLLMALREHLRRFESMQARAQAQVQWMSIQKDVRVPTEYGAMNMHVYMDNRGREHLAVVSGNIHTNQPVLVRIHSECLTGDVFKSFKCDCGFQLDSALKKMAEAADRGQGGVLLYMRDEGRGIGLGNKLRAYKFQEEGLNTLEANEVLGLPIDARSYRLPAAILQDLGINKIRLITNNPEKIAQLQAEGIEVIREAIASPQNPHNADYLQTKNLHMGHDIFIDDTFHAAEKRNT